MLNDIINDYIKAVKANKKQLAKDLKKQLNKLGVDNYTLFVLTGIK